MYDKIQHTIRRVVEVAGNNCSVGDIDADWLASWGPHKYLARDWLFRPTVVEREVEPSYGIYRNYLRRSTVVCFLMARGLANNIKRKKKTSIRASGFA